MAQILLGIESAESRSLPLSAQRLVNFFTERQHPDAKSQIPLFGVPGQVEFTDSGAGPIRGFTVMGNNLGSGSIYTVSGSEFYRNDDDGTVTLLGSGIAAPSSLPTAGTGLVSMANNGSQIIIVNGSAGWAYLLVGVTTTLAADALGATDSAATAVPAAGGALYAVGDTITLTGGTIIAPIILEVATLSGSAVATVTILDPGVFSVFPTNPVAQGSTSGTGTGATFNLTSVTNAAAFEPVQITGFNAGDPVTVTLDSGATLVSTVTRVQRPYVFIADALPSAASTGNAVSDTVPSFNVIDDPNFHGANTVQLFDNYFVFDWPATNRFYISNLLDGTTFSGLDFASADVTSGGVIATVENLQLLFIFSTDHIELWYDSGAPDFPFQRYAGGVINYGCGAPYSIVKQDGAIFFLGDDKIFYRLQGNQPIRISTHEIEHIIALDGAPSFAFCLTYTLEGHKMIALTLPRSNRTLEYDISSQRWHERESWDADNNSLGRWRANCAILAFDQTFVGDAFDGRISRMDWSVYTEMGNTIRGLIHSAPLHHDRKKVYVSRFELDIQAGPGLNSGQGSDPQLMLRYSKDGGHTWSLLQPWRSMGKIGEFLQRLRWLRLGQAYQWCFEITVTDPVPRVIIACHADVEIGL